MSDENKRPGLTLVSMDGTPAPRPQAGDTIEGRGANDEALRIKLAKLEDEHRDLDAAILSMEERMPYDRITIQRLKKRKLSLRDDITKLHAQILPDIIA